MWRVVHNPKMTTTILHQYAVLWEDRFLSRVRSILSISSGLEAALYLHFPSSLSPILSLLEVLLSSRPVCLGFLLGCFAGNISLKISIVLSRLAWLRILRLLTRVFASIALMSSLSFWLLSLGTLALIIRSFDRMSSSGD